VPQIALLMGLGFLYSKKELSVYFTDEGDYWLAEILSYRGRHYIRDNQIEKGKADFARALLIPARSNPLQQGNLFKQSTSHKALPTKHRPRRSRLRQDYR